MKKLQHIIYIFILVIICLTAPQIQAQTKDDSIEHLLQRVRVTFNQNNEQEFYDAIYKYRNYLLEKDDLSGFYLSWKNEVLYDVNHNHFYRALRKTMAMQNDMEERGAKREYYHTTHLRGII